MPKYRQPPPLFSQQELASMWEVTEGTMSKWLADLDPDEEDGRKRRYTCKRVHDHLNGIGLDLNAERARLAKEQADKLARERQVAEGELLVRAEVEADILRGLSEVKTSLLAGPRKWAPLVTGMESISEVESILDDGIREALSAAAVVGQSVHEGANAAA